MNPASNYRIRGAVALFNYLLLFNLAVLSTNCLPAVAQSNTAPPRPAFEIHVTGKGFTNLLGEGFTTNSLRKLLEKYYDKIYSTWPDSSRLSLDSLKLGDNIHDYNFGIKGEQEVLIWEMENFDEQDYFKEHDTISSDGGAVMTIRNKSFIYVKGDVPAMAVEELSKQSGGVNISTQLIRVNVHVPVAIALHEADSTKFEEVFLKRLGVNFNDLTGIRQLNTVVNSIQDWQRVYRDIENLQIDISGGEEYSEIWLTIKPRAESKVAEFAKVHEKRDLHNLNLAVADADFTYFKSIRPEYLEKDKRIGLELALNQQPWTTLEEKFIKARCAAIDSLVGDFTMFSYNTRGTQPNRGLYFVESTDGESLLWNWVNLQKVILARQAVMEKKDRLFSNPPLSPLHFNAVIEHGLALEDSTIQSTTVAQGNKKILLIEEKSEEVQDSMFYPMPSYQVSGKGDARGMAIVLDTTNAYAVQTGVATEHSSFNAMLKEYLLLEKGPFWGMMMNLATPSSTESLKTLSFLISGMPLEGQDALGLMVGSYFPLFLKEMTLQSAEAPTYSSFILWSEESQIKGRILIPNNQLDKGN